MFVLVNRIISNTEKYLKLKEYLKEYESFHQDTEQTEFNNLNTKINEVMYCLFILIYLFFIVCFFVVFCCLCDV